MRGPMKILEFSKWKTCKLASKGREVHSARAQVLHSTATKSPIKDKIEFAHNVWKCRYNIIDTNGEVFNCDFQCCENMSLLSFTHVSNYEVQLWLVNHKLQDVKCNMSVHGLPCQGDCYPTSLPHGKIGMTCKKVTDYPREVCEGSGAWENYH